MEIKKKLKKRKSEEKEMGWGVSQWRRHLGCSAFPPLASLHINLPLWCCAYRINAEVWVRRPRDERCLRLWPTLAHQRKAELCMPCTDWQLDGWLALSSSEHTELKWDPPGEEPHVLLLEVAAVSLDLVWSKSCLTILPIYMQHSSLIHQVLYWFNLLLPYFRSY